MVKAGFNKQKSLLHVNRDNHKLTEYFPIRRSIRKTKKHVLREQQTWLENVIRRETEEGLEIRHVEDKGRSIFATRDFAKGAFVVEYSGDFISIAEANEREDQYSQDESTGCYMYYFKYNDQQFCIDATKESGRMGRLINHSRTNSNLFTKTVMVDGLPRLVLFAKENIKKGEELLYDYGDRARESLQNHPWLKY
ncbi:N-lysine methyltransferase KMT5A-A-like [Cylas formicarius]|uniref:N-lysine methyltransferase KMT5A-A-like n=1 Tax=Cylas formicarius TaxID=197179 RepID=UPI002958A8D4|nr:N-lysine methyltransferase KMT5A-A-like [Cylas formicarius]XP_060532753.1 N-lysine methyltransferase KMT5A-A-like [Cylas formicarius]